MRRKSQFADKIGERSAYGKLSIGVVKFYNMVQAVIGISA